MKNEGGAQIEGLSVLLHATGAFALILGLVRAEERTVSLVSGMAFLAVGFLFARSKDFSWIHYLRDWLMALIVLDAMMLVTGLCLFVSGSANLPLPMALLLLLLLALPLCGMIVLWRRLKPRDPKARRGSRAKASAPKRETHWRARLADQASWSAVKIKAPPKEPDAPPAPSSAEPSAASAAPSTATSAAPMTGEMMELLEELAASTPPLPEDYLSAKGQAALLYAASRALPQLDALRAPGMCGYRLAHASDGGEAHDALTELLPIVERLLGEMSEGDMEFLFGGLSHSEALLAWKALRFYAGMSERPDAYKAACALLATKVRGGCAREGK